jgi:heparinase II/III-like protein
VNKLLLYADSLRRTSPDQLYYRLANRVWPQCQRKLGLSRRKPLHPDARDSAAVVEAELTARLRQLLPRFSPSGDSTTPPGPERPRDRYHVRLEAAWAGPQPADVLAHLELQWLRPERSEETRNFQRFHLFDRHAATVPGGWSTIRNAMVRWMAVYRRMPPLADDPFDCALRCLNWLRIMRESREGTGTGTHFATELAAWLRSHGRLLLRRTEYEVPGNHVLFELYVAWLIAALLRDPDGNEKEIGALLGRECLRQFGMSGYHQEHSPHYHLQSTLLVILWLHGLRSVAAPLSKSMTELVTRAARHVQTLRNAPTLPRVGDNCYCLFTASGEEDLTLFDQWTSRAYVESSTRGKPEVAAIDRQFLVGRAARFSVVLNTGSFGHRQNPGHAHSDLLSMALYFEGMPVLIDPGTASYDDPVDSLVLKRGIIHNTISLNGEDQAILWGAFRWSFLPKTTYVSCLQEGDAGTLESRCVVDTPRIRYEHRRRIVLTDDAVEVQDRVTASGAREVSLAFTFAPGWRVNLESGELGVSRNGHRLRMKSHTAKGQVPVYEIAEVEIYPEYGWATPTHRATARLSVNDFPMDLTTRIHCLAEINASREELPGCDQQPQQAQ